VHVLARKQKLEHLAPLQDSLRAPLNELKLKAGFFAMAVEPFGSTSAITFREAN
jgi:hypothetical protein